MREAGIHRIEMHVAGACIRETGGRLEMLALHRAPTRTLFPGHWEGIGGQVGPGESLEDAVARHLIDEARLAGNIMGPVATYVIDPGPSSGAAELIPGVRFLVRLAEVAQPVIDPRQHQDWRWVPVNQLSRVRWIPGMLDQLRRAVTTYHAFD